jgi:hypothetical protein
MATTTLPPGDQATPTSSASCAGGQSSPNCTRRSEERRPQSVRPGAASLVVRLRAQPGARDPPIADSATTSRRSEMRWSPPPKVAAASHDGWRDLRQPYSGKLRSLPTLPVAARSLRLWVSGCGLWRGAAGWLWLGRCGGVSPPRHTEVAAAYRAHPGILRCTFPMWNPFENKIDLFRALSFYAKGLISLSLLSFLRIAPSAQERQRNIRVDLRPSDGAWCHRESKCSSFFSSLYY